MTDRHVDFRPYQVRAALAGRLSQTRRVLKPQPNMLNGGRPLNDGRGSYSVEGGWKRIPYAPGDRLWVREGHAMVPTTAYRMSAGVVQTVNPEDSDRACIYREGWNRSNGGFRWRSPIHMPRWASRLTLLVTDVRVQRLQEISRGDARAEGVGSTLTRFPDGGSIGHPASWHFEQLWGQIHGPDAWDANPWVAAISFTVHRCNIDTMEEGTW